MDGALAVSPDVLIPPDDGMRRGFDAPEAALVLDAWLRRLAAQDSACRLVLGRIADRFLRRRGHHELGFSRVGDYARERLGLSGRELQSLATVVRRLGNLPRIAAAFEAGTVSWAHVRLLVDVATAETEADWLVVAAARTVRALQAYIRASRDPVPDDGEPSTRFRIRCSRRVHRLWIETVELARRMAGADLSQADAAEAIAAEGLAARPAVDDVRPVPRPGPAASPDPAESHCAFATALDWSPIHEAVPDDLAPLGASLDELDAFALDARLRIVVAALRRLDWQTGRLLRVFLDRRLYRLMLFPSAARYLRERLGISARRGRALVAVERKTWQAPAFDAAYRSGALTWVRALALLPVVHETNAAAWVERARSVTVRRLQDEVDWSVLQDDPMPPAGGTRLNLLEGQLCARPSWEPIDAEVAFDAPESVVRLLETAIITFRGFEELLRHVRAAWVAQPRHRDPIFDRDGWRCAVPACTARRNLHDHHLVFRSRGGDNGRDNRITICAWHHLRGIHAGRVRAWGEAPDRVTWELGVRPGRPALLHFTGDVYA